MANDVTITIDGKEVQTQEGEFILNAARANDIFIPAICYLTRCSPTLACRICLVEADGKQVYACNAKAKAGMNITTSTETIEEERRAIMEVYDVNHPLQCGVCDQSGECELQNYTLSEKVDSQSYAIADVAREAQDWGLMKYDPGLCIVCERCTTACKDMIGDSAITTVARNGGPIDGEFKESMPKDAYAMWNKLNKSVIGPTKGDTLDCTSCGECIAVCPVGALVSSDFQYTTNAWELDQVPATCSHCSAGCQVIYDKKHTDIGDSNERIYRVKNDWNYQTLCGAGRFGYDFENRDVEQNSDALALAVEAFNKADTITFTTQITNEEALMLQNVKEKTGAKLVNTEAFSYNKFLENYAAISGNKLYSADLKTVHASDFVISVGTAIKTDNPGARFALNNSMIMNKGAALYFHPVEDSVIAGLGKNIVTVQHKVGLEEAVLYLVLDLFGNKEKLPKEVTDYLASFHSTKTITVTETIKEKVVEKVMVKKVNEETGEEEEVEEEKTKMVPKKVDKEVEVDDNRLFDIVGMPAKFEETLEKLLKKKEKFTLIAGEDLYDHAKSENIAKLVALVDKYSAFDVVAIPPKSNALGVALICDLDEVASGYTVGYNVKADFTLSALGTGDLDMPAFNQQEGTLTTINKQVVPTNAALDYSGYVLNDVVNALLDLDVEHTIEYTPALEKIRGYVSHTFDDLDNEFTNQMEEKRGYAVEAIRVETVAEVVKPFDENSAMDASIYLADPVLQFNDFTAKTHQLENKGGMFISQALATKLDVQQSDKVSVEANGATIALSISIDSKIDGEIAFVSRFDSTIDTLSLFNGYRFNQAKIVKV